MHPTYPRAYAHAILRGLQSKPVYEGTAPPHVVERRRAANHTARRSRRANRKAGNR